MFGVLYKICMEEFLKIYSVSNEAKDLLYRYVSLLVDWQNKMNLVSPKSLQNVWIRHVADSYQLYQHLNADTKVVCDIGSGAGFPAIVLAICSLSDHRRTQFKLIESITKKTLFLNEVKNQLGLKNVEIINDRSENLRLKPADVVTARAVAELSKLFCFALPLINVNTVLLFPKGKSYTQELRDAKVQWSFNFDIVQNQIEPEGVVLRITNLRKKG